MARQIMQSKYVKAICCYIKGAFFSRLMAVTGILHFTSFQVMMLSAHVVLLLASLCLTELATATSSDGNYPVVVGGRNRTILQKVFYGILSNPHIARLITEITAIIDRIYTTILNILLTPYILAIGKGQRWNS
jgi:hypothetical protein